MNPSALDKTIAALKNSISILDTKSKSLDFWLIFWTALIAIGVFLEIFGIIKEYISSHRAWGRGIIEGPEKPGLGFFLFELFGVMLVTAGVAGELWVNVAAGRINSALRIENSKLVSLVNQKAGFAFSEAKSAWGYADKAAVASSQAQGQSKAAAIEAGNARAAAGVASKSAGVANAQAQQAQRAAQKAQGLAASAEARAEALTPRNLTVDDIKELWGVTQKFKGVPATLMWGQGDPEVNHIAGQVMMSLWYWKVQYINFEYASVELPGIQIMTFSSASQEQRDAAKGLALELSKHLRNISLSIDNRWTTPGKTLKEKEGSLSITIGPLLWGTSTGGPMIFSK